VTHRSIFCKLPDLNPTVTNALVVWMNGYPNDM
jgi:hypothetical protein